MKKFMIICIFALLMIGIGIGFMFFEKQKNEQIPIEPIPPVLNGCKEVTLTDENIKILQEKQINLENKLNELTKKYVQESFDWEFFADVKENKIKNNPNGFEIAFSLKQMGEDFKRDISMFNNDDVNCILDKSFGVLKQDAEGNRTYESNLICNYTLKLTECDLKES